MADGAHDANGTVWVDWGRGPATPLSQWENRLGVFATTLWSIIGCIGDVFSLVALSHERRSPLPALMIVEGLIACSILLQLYCVALVWTSIRREEQGFGRRLIATLPSLPWICRPVLSLLWLLQFALGCFYILAADGVVDVPDSRISPQLWFVKALIIFVCAYATYLYLLLAVATLVRSERLANAIWRWRFVVDVLLTLVVLLHPGRWHS